MKMKNSLNAGLFINVIMCWAISAKSAAKDGEIEVKLQFLEYELEDFCVLKNEAEWKFLSGSDHNLKKFLDVEVKESEFYKHELELLQKHIGKKFFNERLQRLVDIFSHPGAPLLGHMEFKEYRDYSVKLQELVGTMKIQCYDNEGTASITNEILHSNSSETERCNSIDCRKMRKILFGEKNEKKLKELWTKWYRALEDKNKKTKYDFVQQLSILDLEAEQNGEEELTEYWLKQTDTTWINYETAKSLWKEILPLYDKLKHFLTSFVVQKFGKSVMREKLIPAHVLGSLVTHDWLTAAQKLEVFDTSNVYKSLQHSLKQKKVEDLYKAADNKTAELKLGYLPLNFYEKSLFNVSSQTCQHKIMNYCERENTLRAIFCADEVPNIKHYLQINENVIKIKHQLLSGKEEEENGFLFREGPRESALHEAVEGLASIRALWPEILESQGLLSNQSEQQMRVLSLLITALHIIPPLPYYLAVDLWRINALKEIDAIVGENADTTSLPEFFSTINNSKKKEIENENGEFTVSGANNYEDESTRQIESGYSEGIKTYTTENLTKDWWSYRHHYQGIGSPDGKFYEDYLQDPNIIWNKPYLSKFLGKILQFQILEKSKNLTTDLTDDIRSMLQKGKSKSWENVVEDTFNISEISAAPLLKYFKPLEEFLDNRIIFKNSTQIFNFHDLNFIPQGFSLNPTSNEDEGEKPAEGSDALFFSLAIIAAIGVVAIIIIIGRRRHRRKQRIRERKRRLAEF